VRPGAILELFKTPYGIRTLLVSILVVTQAVEFYGISLYTPKILTALLGNRIELVLLLSAVANTFGVIGAVLCVMTVQRVGLRRLAVMGYAVTFGCLAVISGAYAFPVLLSAVGQRATIGYIALAPLIGLLVVLLIKWDPIGKDVEVAPQTNAIADAGAGGWRAR
jgi:hypothetical protein